MSTASDSLGLVTIIMTTAPPRSSMLRIAWEMAVPAAAFTWVVSAVSRDITSPE